MRHLVNIFGRSARRASSQSRTVQLRQYHTQSESDSFLFNEIQLILAEKRTSLPPCAPGYYIRAATFRVERSGCPPTVFTIRVSHGRDARIAADFESGAHCSGRLSHIARVKRIATYDFLIRQIKTQAQHTGRVLE